MCIRLWAFSRLEGSRWLPLVRRHGSSVVFIPSGLELLFLLENTFAVYCPMQPTCVAPYSDPVSLKPIAFPVWHGTDHLLQKQVPSRTGAEIVFMLQLCITMKKVYSKIKASNYFMHLNAIIRGEISKLYKCFHKKNCSKTVQNYVCICVQFIYSLYIHVYMYVCVQFV